MARTYDDVNEQRFEVDAASITAWPLTVHCWAKPDEVDGSLGMFWIGDKDVANMWLLALRMNGGDAGDPLRLSTRDAASQENDVTTNGFTVDTWSCVIGSVAANGNIRVRLDAVAAATGNSTRAVTVVDRMSVGRFGDSSPGNEWSGDLGPITMWNAVLSVNEEDALISGVYPLYVRRANIIEHWPMDGLYSPERSLISGGNNLTVGGTGTPTRSNNPPISLQNFGRELGGFPLVEAGAPPVGVGIRNPFGGPMVLRNPLGA